MFGARAWSILAILLLVAPAGQALVPSVIASEDPSEAPPATASVVIGAPGPLQQAADASPATPATGPAVAPSAGPQVPQTLEAALAEMESMLPEGAEPDSLLNLRELVAMQQAENGTNETTITDEHGTVSHRHANVGEQGLSPVWVAAFYGTPSVFAYMDVDGDGTDDTLVGSSIAITALSGATGQPLWAHHIGSRIVSIFPIDSNSDGVMEVGFATRFGGQNPQIAVLRAIDGHEVWAHFGEASYIDAAPAVDGLGDIVALDIRGNHVRLAGADGSVIREDAPFPAIPGLYDYGAYDGAVADVNGDGVQDTVSAHFTRLYQSAVVERVSSYQVFVQAVDGSTGEVLWVSEVGSPPSDFFSYTFLTGFTTLDANGDGAQDVAFSAYGYTYYYATFVGFYQVYGAYLHIIDGKSQTLGQPIGVRDIVQPELNIDYYGELSAHDGDGDGKDELLVLHESVVNSLSGSQMAIERYAAATTGSQLALVSDIAVPATYTAHFGAPFEVGGATLIPVAWLEGLTGKVALLQEDGTLTETVEFAGAGVTAVGHDGDQYLIGTTEAVIYRDSPGGDDSLTFAMRGTPYVLAAADHDGDHIDDMWTVSSDGNVYIIDGLTGAVLDTVDRDDIVVDIHLQDADGDGDIDPYFELLQEGESFEGVYYFYDAQTVLYDLEEDAPVWQVDGAPFRSLWYDADGDGVDDFLADFDRDYDYDSDRGDWVTIMTYRIVNGATGSNIDSVSVKTGGFVYPNEVTAFRTADGMGIALVDPYDGFVMIGADGKKITSEVFDDDYYWGACLGAVDFDGDGIDSIVFAGSEDETTTSFVYSATGNKSKAEIVPNIDIDDCLMIGVDDRKGGEDLLIMVTDYAGDDVRRIMMRYSEADGEVWKEDGQQGTPGDGWFTYIGRDARAPEGGRIFYGYQDHVYTRSWDTGDIVGQFTVNGPFVRAGAMIELDGKSPSEVVALTSDGLVWALAEDRDAVVEAVAKEAKEQGKDLTTDLDDVQEILDTAAKDRKSPGVAFPVLVLALAALALARRR